MKAKRLILKKEIVANLSDAESNQIRGGTGQGDTYCITLSCHGGCSGNCPSGSFVCGGLDTAVPTTCGGGSYCACSQACK